MYSSSDMLGCGGGASAAIAAAVGAERSVRVWPARRADLSHGPDGAFAPDAQIRAQQRVGLAVLRETRAQRGRVRELGGQRMVAPRRARQLARHEAPAADDQRKAGGSPARRRSRSAQDRLTATAAGRARPVLRRRASHARLPRSHPRAASAGQSGRRRRRPSDPEERVALNTRPVRTRQRSRRRHVERHRLPVDRIRDVAAPESGERAGTYKRAPSATYCAPSPPSALCRIIPPLPKNSMTS